MWVKVYVKQAGGACTQVTALAGPESEPRLATPLPASLCPGITWIWTIAFQQESNKQELSNLLAFALACSSLCLGSLFSPFCSLFYSLSPYDCTRDTLEISLGSSGCLEMLCWALIHTVCYLTSWKTCFSPQSPTLEYELSEVLSKDSHFTVLSMEVFNNCWLPWFI